MADMEADGSDDRLTFWQSPAARLTVGGVLGVVVALLLWRTPVWVPLLAGWIALAFVFSGWTWLLLWRFTSDDTRDHAQQEEPWRLGAVVGLVLVGAVASLAGVALLLERGRDFAGLAIGSVVLSWFTVHTVYALLYARFYFGQNPYGGIDFNSPLKEAYVPCYRDFFYVAFAVGMSFAIPDTNMTSTRMRSTALGQGLLSFAFGAIIIASVVNLIPSL